MLPQANLSEHLLALDLPIVAPIFFKDCGDPLAFDWDPESGRPDPIIDYPVDRVFEAPAGVGTGVMLIKREVLEALEDPWFGFGPQLDLDFCQRAAAKGFKSYCDSRILVQQMGKASPIGKTAWDERRKSDGKQ